jgi:predicted transposase YdaD
MSGKPFDTTTKELIQDHPRDWLDYLGLPVVSVTVVDADLSTVSPDADKILVVDAEPPYIAHLELQSAYKSDDAARFMRYNVLAESIHDLLVRTVVFLLRSEADGPCMRVPLTRQFPDEPEYLHFKFRVVRVWEQPVDAILQGGVGLLPLAPLCNVSPNALPDVIRQMEQRIEVSAPDEAATLWTSTYLLMGLRYSPEFAARLLRGVRTMKESSTYQAILEEGEARGEARGEAKGRIEGERRVLLRLGTRRFGEPDAITLETIRAIASLERLDQLNDKLLEAENWAELLG